MFSSFWTSSLFSEKFSCGSASAICEALPNVVKSFQPRAKEKGKLKNLENVHFQRHFAKQTFQVFLSKLRSLLTCVCLIIYTFFKGLEKMTSSTLVIRFVASVWKMFLLPGHKAMGRADSVCSWTCLVLVQCLWQSGLIHELVYKSAWWD